MSYKSVRQKKSLVEDLDEVDHAPSAPATPELPSLKSMIQQAFGGRVGRPRLPRKYSKGLHQWASDIWTGERRAHKRRGLKPILDTDMKPVWRISSLEFRKKKKEPEKKSEPFKRLIQS
ncbi:MAG TPA: hypothetical protein VFE98_02005 [Candidatus Bathyarchaeia archaeon]|nr:hypothetical protein [Candidatus Bathyarchaeia archaeon]